MSNQDFAKAIADGDYDSILTFVKEGVNLTYAKNGPLYLACDYGHTKIVRFLLSFDEVKKSAHEYNNRCLIAAQRNEFIDIEMLLLKLPNVVEGMSLRKVGFGVL